MLEILFLIWFGRKLSTIAQSKGRSGGWAALGVLFWIGGEILGFVIGSLLNLDAGAYLIAILIAVGCAVVAWVIVNQLSDVAGGGEGTVWPKN
ncbi:MAG: hypothetical protein EXR72_26455 [Myxococcales bacterium]|nr:hypothetical protein [Myxococcales bacterium]